MARQDQDGSDRFGRFRRASADPESSVPPPEPRFPHDIPIRTAGLSCDRRILVCLDAQGFVNGWNAVTAKRLYRLPLLDSKEVAQRLTFSPDGRFAALSSWALPAGVVRILDPRTGQELRRFDRGFSPSFSPDGELMACSDGTQLRRWALKSGAELPRFPECEYALKWTCWSPAGNVIAASGEEAPAVAIWEAATGRRRENVLSESEAAAGLAISPEGNILAVGSHWGIRFFPLGNPQWRDCHAHEEYSFSPLKFSRDGRRMIALSHRRRLLVWETFTGKPLFTWASFQTEDGSLEISEGGDVALWIERGGIRLERIPRLLAGPEEGHVVRTLCFTPEGHVVTGDDRGMIRVWDPATEKEIRRHQVPLVRMRVFSRNGAWALFGGADDPVGIWDLRTGKEVLKVDAKPSVGALALSPDNSRLALGHADGTVSLWDIAEKKESARIRSEMSGITAVAWSPDGKSLAWGDNLGAVCMAEGKQGREPVRFKARAWPAIRELQFTADGKMLVATDAGGSRRVYSEPGIEPKETGDVLDGLLGASTYDLRVARRWRASGCLQKNLAVASVISPDGSYLAGITSDGKLVIWEAPGAK